jgi:Zn finger protein HypA/HybF involved in hydrogenase expression
MSVDSDTRDLLVRGIAAAKAREVGEAYFFLKWLLRLDPPAEERIEALYWLSEICTDPAEQRGYLEDMLAIDQGEPRARRKLAILDHKLDPAEIIDPDHLAQPAPGKPAAAAADRFTCPHCGGRMTFAPDGQSLTCESCEVRQHLGQPPKGRDKIIEDDFVVAMATARGHLQPTTLHTFTCQGCGAVFILPPDQVTATCPYCRSNYAVRQAETHTMIAPEGVIPFSVNELEARRNLKTWLEAEPAVGPAKVAPGQGMYLPVWSFSIDGKITWRCLQSSHGVWLPREGQEPVLFDNVLVLATRRLPEVLSPAIYRFDLALVVTYDDRCLASWIAETYQVTVAEASLDARQSILETEKKVVMEQLTGQVHDLILNSSDVQVEAFKLILVPIWLTHYTVGDNRYNVLINGQSGEVYGERPKTGLLKWVKSITG